MADNKERTKEEPSKGQAKARPKVDTDKFLSRMNDLVAALVQRIVENGGFPQPPQVAEVAEGFDNLKQCDPDEDDAKKVVDDEGGMGGVARMVKVDPIGAVDKIKVIASKIQQVRTASYLNGLRQVFSTVHHAKSQNSVPAQAQALRMLDSLLNRAPQADRDMLSKAREAVLAGTEHGFDAAEARLRHVFASKVPQVPATRVAYTLLGTQDGEGYQLCPKAVHQIGKAIPMEISKCRDNCIDSKVTKEGRVTCAYANWLKVVADSHVLMEDRIERIRHPFNEGSSMNLADGERSKEDPTTGWEGRLEESKTARKGEPKEKSIETQLESAKSAEGGHQGDSEDRIQTLHSKKEKDRDTIEKSLETKQDVKEDADDTIEKLLGDEHDPFSDEEAEMLIEELLDKSRKPAK